MAGLTARSRRASLLLDAGALIALSERDTWTRAALAQALLRDYAVAVPTPVVAQVHRSGRKRAGMDHVFKSVDRFLPTQLDTARRAGELLGRASMSDAVDAIVAAEAIRCAPAMILTSDPDDLARLVMAGEASDRVRVVGIGSVGRGSRSRCVSRRGTRSG